MNAISNRAQDNATIAVVGAGWAGLSAAFRLTQLGHSVHLYDSAPQAGGRARGLNLSFLGQERKLDNGQHLLIGAYTQTLALLSQALSTQREADSTHRLYKPGQNPEQSRVNPSPKHEMSPFLLRQARPLESGPSQSAASGTHRPLHFGRWAAADAARWLAWLPQIGTALGLMRAKGLAIQDKLAFIRLMGRLKRAKFQGFEGFTVLKLLQETSQPTSLIARVWDPLCVSALNTGIDLACAQTFVNVLHDSLVAPPERTNTAGPDSTPKSNKVFPSDYVIPHQDLSQYFVEPVLNAFQAKGGLVHLRQTIRDLSDLPAERIILAVPPHAAATLIEGRQTTLAQRLLQFEYQSITTVYLAWDCALASLNGGPTLLREEPELAAYGQWLFNRGFEQGIQVAAVVVSARGRYTDLDTEALSANIAQQVQRQAGLPLAQAWRAITEKRATFSCTPERPKLAESEMNFSLSPGCSTEIFLAGDYCYPRYPATLESAVRSGLAAADRVHRSLQDSGQTLCS